MAHIKRAIRAGLLILPIALIWLYLHPLASDEINLNVVAIALALSVISMIDELGTRASNNRTAVALGAALLGVAVASTLVHGGGVSGLRDVAIIGAIVALGITLSLRSDVSYVLAGISFGALLVAGVGWVLSFRRNGMWNGFGYEFTGVTDGGEPETFSAWVGLAASLALVRGSGRQKTLAVGSASILGFTLLMSGQTIGGLTLASLLIGTAFVLVLRKSQKRTRRFLMGAVLLVGIAVVGLVSSRNFSTVIATRIGEFGSVDERYEIWESALQAMTVWGLFFGHGTSFWNQASPTRLNANALQNAAGYPGSSHAHSAYLDFFLAFGIGGAAILLALVAIAVRRSVLAWGVSKDWTTLSFPVLLLFSLALQALSQSNLAVRPLGWLFCGILVGVLVVAQTPRVDDGSKTWAPSGSNRRPTD